MNHIPFSHLVGNNESQLLTRAETLPQRRKKNRSPCANVFVVPNRTQEVASFKRRWIYRDICSSRWEYPSGHACMRNASSWRYPPCHQGEQHSPKRAVVS